MNEIIRNGCLTYPVYDTVWYINHDMMAYRCNLNCSLTKATNLMYYIKKKGY